MAGDLIDGKRSVGLDGGGLRSAAHLTAVALLGQGIIAGKVGFSPAALWLVGAAITIVTGALFLPMRASPSRGATAVAWTVVFAAFAMAAWRLPLIDLYVRAPVLRPKLQPFVLLAGLSIALSSVAILGRPRSVRRACLPVVLTAFSLMGAFYLGLSPNPRIDVFVFHQLGCDALLAGHDPYAMTIPDPYGPRAHFYAEGVVVGGRILCGYCYPPLTLLLSLPARVLAGDVRYAHLTAVVLTAAALAYGFPRRAGRAQMGTVAAVLLLLAPGGFLLLENAWTEPFLVLLVALTTVLAARGRLRSAAVTAGLLLASKQYAPLAAPAILLLVPRPWRVGTVLRCMVPALVAGLVVTLPFVLWDPRAFFRSLTVLNVGVIRSDAISFLPPLIRATGVRPPLLACPILAAAAAGALVVWRAPRTPAGFAAGFGLICLCVFAASPLAFGNYYALAVGCLLVSVAAEG